MDQTKTLPAGSGRLWLVRADWNLYKTIYITLQTKINHLNSIVIPTVMYASRTWKFSAFIIKRSNVFNRIVTIATNEAEHESCWRSMCTVMTTLGSHTQRALNIALVKLWLWRDKSTWQMTSHNWWHKMSLENSSHFIPISIVFK